MNDSTNNHADGSLRTAAAQKRARDAVASPEEKQKNVASTAPSDDAEELSLEFICPITRGLPIRPVTAEDGKVYERADIERWFGTKEGDPTSPMTNVVIGTELIPAPQIRDKIEALVKSGAIDGEVATEWTKKLKREKIIEMKLMKQIRAKAESGDAEAMYRLGLCYGVGIKGLAKDNVQARAWYERSAAAGDPRGLAQFGQYLLAGVGGPQCIGRGLVNVREAAELGSDRGAFILGRAFLHGRYGPKDLYRAQFWLTEVVCGECEFKHLSNADRAQAAEMFREAMACGIGSIVQSP